MYPRCRDMQWEHMCQGSITYVFWRCALRELTDSSKPCPQQQTAVGAESCALANADWLSLDAGFEKERFTATRAH
eukprot:3770784-Amphidinium_carterae.3